MQPASQLSPLEKTLGSHDGFEVDIGSLVLHVHKLVVLSSPMIRMLRLLDKLHRWEASGLTVFILISANIGIVLPTGYYMSLLLGALMLVGGLGVAHRQTHCLMKVFPPVHLKQEDLNRLDGPLTHEELVHYYKAMLYRVDSFVQSCNSRLVAFYSVLKWDNLQVSIRWFTALFVMAISLHLLPARWTVVMTINLFLLEGKIAQAIIERKQYLALQDALQPCDGNEDVVSQASVDSIGSASELGAMAASDTESEISEKPDDLSSSEHDMSDIEILSEEVKSLPAATATAEESGSGLVKKTMKSSGVVGKILEFKKKHQHAHQGNCVGCNVAFSTILKRRHICTNCGNHYCSRCCSNKVPRAMMGATAPSAQTETVAVCNFCYMYLTGKKDPS